MNFNNSFYNLINKTVSIKALGIDFGSSKTTLVGFSDDNVPIILGYREHSRPSFSSVAAKSKREPGSYLFFKDAEICDSNNYRIVDLKEGLYNDDTRKEREELVSRFFKEIFEGINYSKGEYKNREQYDFSKLKSVVIGHPAYCDTGVSESYVASIIPMIRDIISTKFAVYHDIDIAAYPEPVLAAIAYHERRKNAKEYKRAVKENDIVLVLDFGGHTMDIALMQARKNEIDNSIKLVQYRRSSSYFDGAVGMGKNVTRLLRDLIYQEKHRDERPFDYLIDEAKCKVLSGKERMVEGTCLYSDKDAMIKKYVIKYDHELEDDDLKGDTLHVGMRSNSNARNTVKIESIYENVVGRIKNYIGAPEIGLRRECVSHVMFTGGASNIPQLREHIKAMLLNEGFWKNSGEQSVFVMDETCDVPHFEINYRSARDEDLRFSSSNAVALGAALAAKNPELADSIGKFTSDTNEREIRKLEDKIRELEAEIKSLEKKKNAQGAAYSVKAEELRKYGMNMDEIAQRAISALERSEEKKKLEEEYKKLKGKKIQ